MIDTSPLVSICCITYNHEQYIKDALDGFVMQKTDFPFEIVLSDDCSTDLTHNVIKEYKLKYPDLIRDVSPQENKGVIDNWKYVHLEARGKYIAFCEGDDYWTDPLKLQKQVDYMKKNPSCSLCATDFCYQTNTNKNSISSPAYASNITFQPQTFLEHLQNAGYIGPMTWLYKRDLFLQNISDYVNITDGTLALSLDLFCLGDVVYLPDNTAVYRVHNGSAANPINIVKKMQYLKGVYKTQLYYAQKYNCNDKIIDILKLQNYTTSMQLAIDSDDSEFIDEALQFYNSKAINMRWFIEFCKEYVYYKQQYIAIKSSKAYKIGKLILKPFSIFKIKNNL